MPIEVGLWTIGDTPQPVAFSPMGSEELIEDVLAKDLSILDPALLLIGRQVSSWSNVSKPGLA